MAKWTDTTSYPNLASPDAADLLPIAHVSAAAGSQQRTITWAQVEALAAAGATIAAVDPTTGDDTADGYGVGSLWFNSVSGDLFIATDVTEAAAVWATVLDASAVAGGDVIGPGSSTSGNLAEFDGAGGDTLADAGTTVEKLRLQSFIIACGDETTALTVGTAKVTFRVPYPFTVTEVRANTTAAPTGANLEVDINEAGTSILSTVISIDAGDKTSVGATTAPVISDTALADDAEITIDVDQIGSTVAGAGLKVTLIGYAT